MTTPARDLAATYGLSPDDVLPVLHEQFRAYRVTLQEDGRRLLEKFQIVDAATASVLEAYLPKSRFRQHGERVVQGQRMMQAVRDIFLGWTKGWT